MWPDFFLQFEHVLKVELMDDCKKADFFWAKLLAALGKYLENNFGALRLAGDYARSPLHTPDGLGRPEVPWHRDSRLNFAGF